MDEIRRHHVAVGNEGEDDLNTIVLGLDLVLPLEMDIDGDPLQDDEVRLRSLDGSWEKILFSSDDDVEADDDARLMFYRFRDVPRGVFKLSVRIGGEWTDVIRELLIGKEGPTIGGEPLATSRPSAKMAPLESFVLDEEELPPEPTDEERGFMDQLDTDYYGPDHR